MPLFEIIYRHGDCSITIEAKDKEDARRIFKETCPLVEKFQVRPYHEPFIEGGSQYD